MPRAFPLPRRYTFPAGVPVRSPPAITTTAMSTPYLDVQEGSVARRFTLKGDQLVIGREDDCGVVLSDALASRRHCSITHKPAGVWELKDLGSRNGTAVNGVKVNSIRLTAGDVIQIGAATLTFVDPMAEERGGLYAMHTAAAPSVAREPDASDVEMLSEDDVIEEVLDASDVVADDEPAFDVIEAEGDAPTTGNVMFDPTRYTPQVDDPARALESMSAALPDRGVREGDLALMNSRGQITHVAKGQLPAGAKREPVDLFRLLLLVCLKSRATDIHVEPRQEVYGIRLRVDGVMVDVARVEPQFGARLSTLVKVLSDIDIAQRNALQEGHFSARTPSAKAKGQFRRIDYRVSFAPSVFGQKLVIRILDAENAPLTLADLKAPAWMDRELSDFIRQDSGMVIVSGPTGSGKTTTLYSLLRSIDLSQRNAVTIEDPVEMQLEGTTQMPVDEEAGKGFGAILRSVLRQDPDVIMVGEIRDAETARTAMQAAITGHMVLSTVHTRDTLGTVFRLLDLGVEPFLVSQGLNIVVAQRLVRQLCPSCRRKSPATPDQRAKLEAAGFAGVQHVHVPHGCARCLGTGHAGRRGIFELLYVTEEIRNMIQENPSLADLEACVRQTEFVSLHQSAFGLVADGAVSYDEAEKIADRDGKRDTRRGRS